MNRLTKIMAVASIWTVVVWGNRALLLEDNAEWWPVARIMISLGLGIALAMAALGVHQTQRVSTLAKTLTLSFSAAMFVIWLPAAVSVLFGDYDLPFKVVHTLLAGGSLYLAWLVGRRVLE